MTTTLASIEDAIQQIAAGRPIVVVDDEDRENEGDLIMAADAVTAEWMGFIIRYSSGVVCAPIPAQTAQRLALPPMTADNEDPKGTAYTVSVDAKAGVTTGISAADRSLTARLLADPDTRTEDLTRPGHLFPLIAQDDGVLARDGHTEAGLDFARLAGRSPAAVIAEIVHDDGSMMRFAALAEFAREHGLAMVTIADLIAYRKANPDAPMTPVPTTSGKNQSTGPTAAQSAAAGGNTAGRRLVRGETVPLPTDFGTLTATAYTFDGTDHLVLSGPPNADSTPLVRIHSECLTGDVFGSHRCDCGEQLAQALRTIATVGGHVIYVRGHEGRGIGLAAKIAAYSLQDTGVDTVDANTRLGFAADARKYDAVAAILADMGLHSVRLMTNNPTKITALQHMDIDVTRVDAEVAPRPENIAYLATKRDRMSHLLERTL